MKASKNLTDQQKKILFEGETEPAFSGRLLHNHDTGDYVCINCGSKLFDSDTKFDSGSGWPSFYDVASTKAVTLKADTKLNEPRVEVLCANCGGHLGHVFNDAPDQPTGLRFCINSCAMDFKKKGKA